MPRKDLEILRQKMRTEAYQATASIRENHTLVETRSLSNMSDAIELMSSANFHLIGPVQPYFNKVLGTFYLATFKYSDMR